MSKQEKKLPHHIMDWELVGRRGFEPPFTGLRGLALPIKLPAHRKREPDGFAGLAEDPPTGLVDQDHIAVLHYGGAGAILEQHIRVANRIDTADPLVVGADAPYVDCTIQPLTRLHSHHIVDTGAGLGRPQVQHLGNDRRRWGDVPHPGKQREADRPYQEPGQKAVDALMGGCAVAVVVAGGISRLDTRLGGLLMDIQPIPPWGIH